MRLDFISHFTHRKRPQDWPTGSLARSLEFVRIVSRFVKILYSNIHKFDNLVRILNFRFFKIHRIKNFIRKALKNW